MYKVSLIIPVYNVSKFVGESLLSALNQTFESIEYIIVDDCSTDDSITVIKNITKTHQRKKDVFIYEHEINSGVSTARNTGLSKATAEFIFFMDSDDKLSIDCIELHFKAINKSIADFTIANHQTVGSHSIHRSKSCFIQKNDIEIIQSYLKKEWSVCPWNKLIKRNIIIDNHLFFTKEIIHGEDMLWAFQLAICASKMVAVPKTTYYYFIRNGSAISSSFKSQNISSLTYVIEQISLSLFESEIYKRIKKEANSFITFYRLNIALLIINNQDGMHIRTTLFNRLNSCNLKRFDNSSILSFLLHLPFPLFHFLLYLPYNIYKKLQQF